jgi:adenosylcobinamide kinase/adenosylcobinamide-phosphate guanylyltransferase
MILVIGGASSGKRTFVESLGYSQDAIDDGLMGERPVLCHLEQVLLDDQSADDIDALVGRLSKYAVVTCAQLGSGIVPLDARQRLWRDRVGRTCAKLAEHADVVVRMVCGIPVYQKGGPACSS